MSDYAGPKRVLDYSANIKLPQEELDKIGTRVCEDYNRDKLSRRDWETRNAEAMKLALQVMEQKSFPWPNASNVKFPLLTIAAIQFSARAYPALVSSKEPVKCLVNGPDVDGNKSRRAIRVGKHMSYQLLFEDDDWEEQHDRLLLALSIIGTGFKKTYFDTVEAHNESIYVSADDLVCSYYTKSLESSRRFTHVIPLYENEYLERVNEDIFNKIELCDPIKQPDDIKQASDEIHGLQEGEDSDPQHIFLEQHRYLDLDKDGYKEPYIVTVHRDTQKVVRIVNRFKDVKQKPDGTVISIQAKQYFTKYGFIPSPDGGFYDIGFGCLLSPLNESVNSIINQLVDSGTMSNLQSGFLSKGVRMKGGNHRFKPGEWKTTDSYGDDLRKGIVPLPSNEPSTVLFQLLGMLVNYGERLGSSTDMMVGVNPGQNQAASTTMAVVEQGMKVFNGIFKRIHRSMGKEFRKLYGLNRDNLNPYEYFQYLDSQEQVYQNDYTGDESDVTPSSDPNIVSEAQRLAKAEALKNSAASYYGYNRYQVEKRYLEALDIEGIEQILPDPQGENAITPPADPKIEIEKAKLELQNQKLMMETEIAKMKTQISEVETHINAEQQKSNSQLDFANVELKKVEARLRQAETDLKDAQARKTTVETMEILDGEAKQES